LLRNLSPQKVTKKGGQQEASFAPGLSRTSWQNSRAATFCRVRALFLTLQAKIAMPFPVHYPTRSTRFSRSFPADVFQTIMTVFLGLR
jgi:hypothetical protein